LILSRGKTESKTCLIGGNTGFCTSAIFWASFGLYAE
jgi:hypothetical protein